MFLCVHIMPACLYLYTYVYERQMSTLAIFLKNNAPPSIMTPPSHWAWRDPTKPQRSSCHCLSSAGIHAILLDFFMWVLGTWCLCGKHFTDWAFSPILDYVFGLFSVPTKKETSFMIERNTHKWSGKHTATFNRNKNIYPASDIIFNCLVYSLWLLPKYVKILSMLQICNLMFWCIILPLKNIPWVFLQINTSFRFLMKNSKFAAKIYTNFNLI